MGHCRFVELSEYDKTIYEKALLIKVSEERYVCIDFIITRIGEKLADFGFYGETIGTEPSRYDPMFVDEDSLVPYFSTDLKTNIDVKTLKKASQIRKKTNTTN